MQTWGEGMEISARCDKGHQFILFHRKEGDKMVWMQIRKSSTFEGNQTKRNCSISKTILQGVQLFQIVHDMLWKIEII